VTDGRLPRRVLVVTSECAATPRSGGEIRTHRLISALARRARVRVVVLRDTDAEALRVATGADRVDVAGPPPGAARARLRALWRLWPLTTARWWRPEVAALVREEAASGALVVLEHVYLDVLRPRHGSYVLSTQNVETAVHRSLPAPRRLRARLERRWELWRLEVLERDLRRRSRAGVVVVSREDATALGRPDALVVENGADVPHEVAVRPAQGRVLFVGSMTWPPNVEAVRWWLREVRPHLPADFPALSVVGRGGHEVFSGMPGLEVLGEVPEMATVMRETRAVVVPLQHGGGTRLKVLEALAWGRPVISTTKGVEGLRVTDGEHVLVADDGADFAQLVQDAWRDDVLSERLTKAGRALASSYSWDVIGEQYAEGLLGESP